jgi:hypothetical protein
MKLPFHLKKMSFFFSKNGEQGGKTGPVWGLAPERGEDIRKECRRVNMVDMLCTHV